MATRPLEHELRVEHHLFNLLLVAHALQHIVIWVFLQLHFGIFKKFLGTYIRKSNVILTYPSLNTVEQLTNRSPFGDILPFKLGKLLGMHFQLTLLYQELYLIVEGRRIIMVKVLLAVDARRFVQSMGGVAWFVLEIIVHHVLIRVIDGQLLVRLFLKMDFYLVGLQLFLGYTVLSVVLFLGRAVNRLFILLGVGSAASFLRKVLEATLAGLWRLVYSRFSSSDMTVLWVEIINEHRSQEGAIPLHATFLDDGSLLAVAHS